MVTGGSSGIGSSICLRLGELGASVMVGYRTRGEPAGEVANRIVTEHGVEAEPCELDVRDYEQVTRIVNGIIKARGRIDILVNNAGVGVEGAVTPARPVEEWVDVIHTNLIGSFFCIKAVSLHMLLARKGSIVNVSSVAGMVGIPGLSSYSASKAGLIGLTKSLSKEFAPYKVRVNAVAPGYTSETGMVERIGEEDICSIRERIPLRRLARRDEIAETVAYLSSDSTSYVTGQTLVVDGGLTA